MDTDIHCDAIAYLATEAYAQGGDCKPAFQYPSKPIGISR
jgi:hypothetical protein